ncbi:hypothetical protein LZ30DRAFT_808410 [Colletotrichum cereale]|nr:hypothetical protein LZ30DRAFT_808410 [Colletotrichum cereale]
MSNFNTAPPETVAVLKENSCQSICGALNSFANPGEDWKQISDPTDRRRVQNRIAQRTYRKKLKRRLEDLERRVSREDATADSLAQPERLERQSFVSKKSLNTAKVTESMNPCQYTVPTNTNDEASFAQHQDDSCKRSKVVSLSAYAINSAPQRMNFAASYTTQLYATTSEMYLVPMERFDDTIKLEQFLGDRWPPSLQGF